MVLVHHGLFWRNEPLVVDRRQRGPPRGALPRRTPRSLAYHLALDAHPTLGNAAQLAARLGCDRRKARSAASASPARSTGSRSASSTARVARRASTGAPLVFPYGPDRIERLAISTGAAGYDLIRAAHEGFDALLTGEPEEPNFATAQELGIHLVAAGHHATERFGVQALAAHLADTFAIEWRYVEVDNPV